MSWEGQYDLADEWVGHAYSFVCDEVSDKLHSFIKDIQNQACGHASHQIDGIYEPPYGDEQVWDFVTEKILEELDVKETK